MNKIIKMFVSIALFSTMLVASGDLNIISLKKAKGMFNAKSALFMDARGMKLYKKGTILGAVYVPQKKMNLDKVKGMSKKIIQRLPADKKTKIVTFCNGVKCEESDFLAQKLMKLGYTKVYVYKGGVPEWKKEKLPLMAIVKECKSGPKGPYIPKKSSAITINGAKAYWGGDSKDAGMIDQFWLADMIKKNKVPANIQFIDVRKASDFKDGHLPGAINVPWDAKAEKIDHTKFAKDKLNIIYCNTGMMSTDARGSLSDDAAKNVLYFDANVNCEKGKCKVTANEN
ncbi:MAG: rhodanese-like domain-containing protein [Campylobacterota bacterium]|nr:rhodanese-like domain-containing protein [Campylobacterota bacterium]